VASRTTPSEAVRCAAPGQHTARARLHRARSGWSRWARREAPRAKAGDGHDDGSLRRGRRGLAALRVHDALRNESSGSGHAWPPWRRDAARRRLPRAARRVAGWLEPAPPSAWVRLPDRGRHPRSPSIAEPPPAAPSTCRSAGRAACAADVARRASHERCATSAGGHLPETNSMRLSTTSIGTSK
jgi:hypothetical protein